MEFPVDSELFALRPTDVEQPNFIWTWLKISQSWVVSFAIHLLILGGIATIVMPNVPNRPVLSIRAAVQDEVSDEQLVKFELSEAEDSLPLIGDEPQLIDETVFSEIPEPEIRLPSPSSFFGARVSGRRIAFVIDRSSSMRGRKFDQARDEVVRAVNQLVPTQWFYVVFFDRGTLRMFDEDDPADNMLPATPANLERFIAWVSQLKVGSGTMPYQSVKLVMGMEPDTLFLLTDGEFDSGDKTVAHLSEKTLTGIRIHTVGFHHEDDGTLERIAEKHGGTFRFVSRD